GHNSNLEVEGGNLGTQILEDKIQPSKCVNAWFKFFAKVEDPTRSLKFYLKRHK
ncbi:unnamed protein product, partial [Sphenostylis stenocarpa]